MITRDQQIVAQPVGSFQRENCHVAHLLLAPTKAGVVGWHVFFCNIKDDVLNYHILSLAGESSSCIYNYFFLPQNASSSLTPQPLWNVFKQFLMTIDDDLEMLLYVPLDEPSLISSIQLQLFLHRNPRPRQNLAQFLHICCQPENEHFRKERT